MHAACSTLHSETSLRLCLCSSLPPRPRTWHHYRHRIRGTRLHSCGHTWALCLSLFGTSCIVHLKSYELRAERRCTMQQIVVFFMFWSGCDPSPYFIQHRWFMLLVNLVRSWCFSRYFRGAPINVSDAYGLTPCSQICSSTVEWNCADSEVSHLMAQSGNSSILAWLRPLHCAVIHLDYLRLVGIDMQTGRNGQGHGGQAANCPPFGEAGCQIQR